MRLAYVVSRFPQDTEIWFLRELNAIAAVEGLKVELLSLYRPPGPSVQPGAQRWDGSRHRVSKGQALAALAWWMARRPLRLLSSVGVVIAGHARSPGVLLRALVTLGIGAEHARRVKRHGVDHVHAHFATYPALVAWLCRRLAGVPYSFTAHAHDLYVNQAFLERKVLDAEFVVAISDFNRAFLADYGGGSDTPVHVVHCGVDPSLYRFRPRRPPPEGRVRTLCVASLQEHKGHPVLFEAIADAGPVSRIELDLVGGGEREPLERLAARLGIADRVRFHGSLPENEVARLLDECDIFVLPSVVARDGQMEGLPVALMEALASGIPVVASCLSGIPELVREGETGRLAKAGDPVELRSALEATLSDPVDPARGRELIESEFAVRDNAARMARLFRVTGPKVPPGESP